MSLAREARERIEKAPIRVVCNVLLTTIEYDGETCYVTNEDGIRIDIKDVWKLFGEIE